ncbi:glycine zipper 2TM domain-containing protein [Arenimonas sp. MALMAid1274]|uniref:glycine zipper 2TM domain-containing protein n=1 Tax=Arenimonas sp. MALMAid1274 TaxID=3411630 RepID=UPI003B9E9A79
MTEVQIKSHHHHGVGAIVGAGIGLGLGSLVGGGHGRDVAKVVGALAGAKAGRNVAEAHDKPIARVQVVVRLESGVLVVVTQPSSAAPGLRKGQKVYVEGTGNGAQVIPR